MNRRDALFTGLAAAIGLPALAPTKENLMKTLIATPAKRPTPAIDDEEEDGPRVRRQNNVHEERIVILFDALKHELSAIVDECLEVGVSGGENPSANHETYQDASGALWAVGFFESVFDNRVVGFYSDKTPAEVDAIAKRLDLGGITRRYFQNKAGEMEEVMERLEARQKEAATA
jgi:hypothetical protein